MLKYVDVMETFSEVPDEITLAINLSNCPHKCRNCHSSYLQKDIGNELTISALSILIEEHKGISCVAFLGGDNDCKSLLELVRFIKTHYNLKVCWYTGFDEVPFNLFPFNCLFLWLDYIKIGSYKEEFGPLNNPNTNQRFWKRVNDIWTDITYKFQK